MTKSELATRIQRRLQAIQASHSGYISVAPSTLARVLSRELMERICDEAAAEAMVALNGENGRPPDGGADERLIATPGARQWQPQATHGDGSGTHRSDSR